ncbi:hypothetical protein HHK36_004977 [Tetracentron sinense]|uniref:C2 domain-containing protein n=1 Tax=Tetracentron sinense TaxID=13715 RepID=A0A834ZUP1_TETSI|nr:hypothetical protein HHK36_004977 [Tetracentron sinense]
MSLLFHCLVTSALTGLENPVWVCSESSMVDSSFNSIVWRFTYQSAVGNSKTHRLHAMMLALVAGSLRRNVTDVRRETVNEHYVLKLRRKLEFEEKKQANQRRVLSDSETVRWLNRMVENIWPICMEQIASQSFILPIMPWFLEKYKPWTAMEAVFQHLYMGRNPPMLTEIRVLRQSAEDDHVVMELGMNFLSADDMSGILAVKLKKRLGLGMWAKLHVTSMHVEGKILVGVKFLREWPFLGRMRLCFVEAPYFQMTVKPIFTQGLDVTELPGIAGWLDKLLAVAFEQTLVEPNMLVVDVEKFTSAPSESSFSVDEKEPIAYAKVEVLEAADMKPSDLNGLADPYIKGELGSCKFETKIRKKTLDPKWHEEFKIPICTWESPHILSLVVRDKDHFRDDILGNCSINISNLRGGQRHDMWLPLQNIKKGRLHLAVTVVEVSGKGGDHLYDEEPLNQKDNTNSAASESAKKGSNSTELSEKALKMADEFEPINIEGQRQTGIWVHHPGSDISQTWEPRKGKSRNLDSEIRRENNGSTNSSQSGSFGPNQNDNIINDEDPEENKQNSFRGSLRKISSRFHRSSRKEDPSNEGEAVATLPDNSRAVDEDTGMLFIMEDNISGPVNVEDLKVERSLSPNSSSRKEDPSKEGEAVPTPPTNFRAPDEKDTGMLFIMEDSISGPVSVEDLKAEWSLSPNGSSRKDDPSNNGDAVLTPPTNSRAVDVKDTGMAFIVENNISGPVNVEDIKAERSLSPKNNHAESSSKGNMKDRAKNAIKQAGSSARGHIKHVLSRKRSNKSKGDPDSTLIEIGTFQGSNSFDEESLASSVHTSRVDRIPIDSTPIPSYSKEFSNSKEQDVQLDSAINIEDPLITETNLQGVKRTEDDMASNSEGHGEGLVEETSNFKLSEGNSGT